MCKRNTRYDMVSWVLIVIGVVGLFLERVECGPEARHTSFSCANRNPGYYADVTTGCQVYHMCDNVGRQFSYSCPNATLFQQRMLICDHWYMVNCSKAISYYDANLRIGQKDRHFVDDSEVNVVTRTPRPDLLTAPSTTLEYNTIYRHGESNLSPTKYVGVESNDENSTDQATYFPPSNWSTEISKQVISSAENNENRRLDYQITQQNEQNRRIYHDPQSNYQNRRVNDQIPSKKLSEQTYESTKGNDQNQRVNSQSNDQNRRINYQNRSNNDQNVETNQNQESYQNKLANDQNRRQNDQNRRQNDQNRRQNDQNQRANDQNQRANDQNQRANDQNRRENYQNQRENDQNQRANNQNRDTFQNRQIADQSQESNQNSRDSLTNNRRPQPEEYNQNRRNNTRNSGIKGKAIDVSSFNSGHNEIVNFKSNFKATTPVYPRLVKDTTRSPNNIGLLPPLLSSLQTVTTHHQQQQQPELELELLPPKTPQQQIIFSNEGLINEQQLFSNLWSTTPPYPSEDDVKEFEESLREPVTVLVENNDKSGFKINFKSNFKATTPQYPTSVNPTSPDPSDVGVLPPNQNKHPVNFESNYKATTPNYPTSVEQTSQNPSEAGILPPKVSNETKATKIPVGGVFKSNFKATTPNYPSHVDATSPNPADVGLLAPRAKVVYKSNFKATTPQYPSFVDATSQNPSDVGLVAPKDTVVNFHSDFKATTPNYPKSVASTSPDPGQAGLLAPQPSNEIQGLKSDEYITSSNNYNQFPFKVIDPTSEYIEEGDLQEIPGIRISNFMKSFDYKQWQELRDAFRIPEYEFPLDYATRPSYNSVVNSFEPISISK